MGRTVKRVPMDFDWPWHKVWKGYINPYHGVDCPYCYRKEDNSSDGLSKEASKYYNLFYGYKCKGNYITNPYRPNMRYNPNSKPYNMECWEYEFIIDNDDLRMSLFGDEVPSYENVLECLLKQNFVDYMYIQWPLTEEYCRRNGFEAYCHHCHGEGTVWQTPKIKDLSENYQGIEPPTGDGYQLWETTSEGSPVSPVFATFDELCEWCADNATTFASFKATKEEWAKMLDDGFVYHKEGNIIMC